MKKNFSIAYGIMWIVLILALISGAVLPALVSSKLPIHIIIIIALFVLFLLYVAIYWLVDTFILKPMRIDYE